MALFRRAAADFAAYRITSAGALYFDARIQSGQSTLLQHWRINFLGAVECAGSGMGVISVSAGTTVLDTGWVRIAAAGGLFVLVLSR